MWNEPTKEDLDKIPRLYETEGIPAKAKIIHMHCFAAGCDWWITETDGEDICFGFACLNQDFDNAEWGYCSLTELKELKAFGWLEVDRDLHWKVRPACEVSDICKAQGWPMPESKSTPKQTEEHLEVEDELVGME